MSAMSDQKAIEFIEETREEITGVELPALVKYQQALEKCLQNGQIRLQKEMLTQEQLLLEIIRLNYRLANLVHQLMNTEPLLGLLRQHFEREEQDALAMGDRG